MTPCGGSFFGLPLYVLKIHAVKNLRHFSIQELAIKIIRLIDLHIFFLGRQKPKILTQTMV